ncbi:hypothetical protein Tco_0935130 [Tanacetum coccineum]
MPTCSAGQNPITPYSEQEHFIHQTLRKKKKRNPFIPIEDRVPKTKYPPFENPFEAKVVYNSFLDLPFPMADDQPMWGNNRAVAPTPGAAIVAVDLGDNFTVKGHHLSMIKDRQFDGCSRADPYKHIAEFVEHVNVVFIRSGNTYDPPANPNTKTAVLFDNSKHEAEEVEKEAEPLPKKLTQTDTPPLKAYKPKIPYPQCLNKEKIEARYAMFLDMIKEVRINIPLVDILAGMPNYGKILKDLVRNKSKMEQISTAFLTEECSAILQNKIPPKLGDPRSFLIPCKLANLVEYLALADLGPSINLMPYSLYAALSRTNLKPTRMRRPFLHTADTIIRVKNKELNLRFGEDRATFHIGKAMQHFYVNDDTCFRMDVIDEITEDELDALLDDSKSFLNTLEKISETPLDKEFDEFMSGNVQEDEVKDDFEELPPKDKLRIRTSI